MINVTRTYLPPFEEYTHMLRRAWDKAWITNNGELVKELEEKLMAYLGCQNLLYCGTGTIVLQMALKALDITKEVITTPFSYVATTNAILWEGCTPVFTDILPGSCCIDADKIEAAITENTQAILATHVYGYPCDVDKIERIAAKHDLKVIYDAAHAFGCEYKGRSLLSFGDISTCSFHATKIFHSVEGGCIISNNEEMNRKLFLYRSFGHIADDYYSIGINGKNSEMHAAMGLCILPRLADIIEKRKEWSVAYNNSLDLSKISRPFSSEAFNYNYAYYPVLFESEEVLLRVKKALADNEIFARRYFYPSLNTLSFLTGANCPVSEDIASRVMTLPLYYDLGLENIARISALVNSNV